MEPTEAELLKAARAKTFLYILMAIMIGVPLVVFFVRHIHFS